MARRASLNARALAVDALGAGLEAKRQSKLKKSRSEQHPPKRNPSPGRTVTLSNPHPPDPHP